MALRWIPRQFLDGFVKNPLRFLFKDVISGNTIYTHDLERVLGAIMEMGTPKHRGYFQPIEDYLAQYESQPLRDKLSMVSARLISIFATLNSKADTVNNNVNAKITTMDGNVTDKITTLTNRIMPIENRLPSYAPLSGASFTNPTANSPAASDNSTRISTTEHIRNFVAQYPFPTKNIKSMTITADGLVLSLKWSDPNDFTYDEMLLSEWSGTKILYRTDRYPTNETDGTLIIDNQYRNGYIQYGLDFDAVAGTTYYVKAFPYTVNNIYNRNIGNVFNTIRVSGMQVLTPLSIVRDHLTATTDNLGRVWFCGGQARGMGDLAYPTSIDIYDTNGSKETLNNGLSIGRYSLSSSTDGNGYVLIGGGWNSNLGGLQDTVEKFNPVNFSREILTPLSVARQNMAASTDGGGCVLFGGGYDGIGTYGVSSVVEKYDLNGNRSALTPLSVARYNLASATDGNGYVLFGGGSTAATNSATYTNAVVDRYDISGNRTILTPLSTSRYRLAAAPGASGSVFFGGGWDANGASDVVDKYDIDGSRTVLAPLSMARGDLTASMTRDGYTLFIGGNAGYNTPSDVIDMYSPAGVRTTISTLSTARMYLTSATDGAGNIVIGGGQTDVSASSDVVDRYTV